MPLSTRRGRANAAAIGCRLGVVVGPVVLVALARGADAPGPDGVRFFREKIEPVRRVAPPAVEDAAWVRNAVDAFVLATLEGRRWRPAPPAGRAEWIRRASFDLVGLPPSPEEVEAFEADPAPDAYERVVDRLL